MRCRRDAARVPHRSRSLTTDATVMMTATTHETGPTTAIGPMLVGRTAITTHGAPAASRIFVSWNQLDGWLRQVEGLRGAA